VGEKSGLLQKLIESAKIGGLSKFIIFYLLLTIGGEVRYRKFALRGKLLV